MLRKRTELKLRLGKKERSPTPHPDTPSLPPRPSLSSLEPHTVFSGLHVAVSTPQKAPQVRMAAMSAPGDELKVLTGHVTTGSGPR